MINTKLFYITLIGMVSMHMHGMHLYDIPGIQNVNVQAALQVQLGGSSKIYWVAGCAAGLAHVVSIWHGRPSWYLGFTDFHRYPHGNCLTQYSLIPNIGFRESRFDVHGKPIGRQQVGLWLSDDNTPANYRNKLLLSIVPSLLVAYSIKKMMD